MCIIRRDSASKCLQGASLANSVEWFERIYSTQNPDSWLGLYDQRMGHLNWLMGNGLCRKTTPLSWLQRLVLLELALFITQGDGGGDSLDVRELAKRCGLKIKQTIDLVDAAPAFFIRRGRTVWLTHPRIREVPRFRRRLMLRHRARQLKVQPC